jgi:N-acetylglucosamine-6-phosphate deacetylase
LPDIRVFQRLQAAAGGHIGLVTLAPELPGSADFIREVVGSGVQVTVGHTNVSLTGLEEYLETARAYFSTYVPFTSISRYRICPTISMPP